MTPAPLTARLAWAWRLRRARRYARLAYLAYQRHPSRLNGRALERADRFLRAVLASRP